jgi:hypothetical protein
LEREQESAGPLGHKCFNFTVKLNALRANFDWEEGQEKLFNFTLKLNFERPKRPLKGGPTIALISILL